MADVLSNSSWCTTPHNVHNKRIPVLRHDLQLRPNGDYRKGSLDNRGLRSLQKLARLAVRLEVWLSQIIITVCPTPTLYTVLYTTTLRALTPLTPLTTPYLNASITRILCFYDPTATYRRSIQRVALGTTFYLLFFICVLNQLS